MRTIDIHNGAICQSGKGIDFPKEIRPDGTVRLVSQLRDWRLVTKHDAADVEAPGYFNELADKMQVGEAILATLDVGGESYLKLYIVTANDLENVTVAPLTVS